MLGSNISSLLYVPLLPEQLDCLLDPPTQPMSQFPHQPISNLQPNQHCHADLCPPPSQSLPTNSIFWVLEHRPPIFLLSANLSYSSSELQPWPSTHSRLSSSFFLSAPHQPSCWSTSGPYPPGPLIQHLRCVTSPEPNLALFLKWDPVQGSQAHC